MCLYLDDGIVCGRSREEVESAVSMITSDFLHAGITLSLEKCSLVPKTSACWLGFEIDLEERVVRIARERVSKAVRRLESLRSSRAPSLRERLQFIGTMNSMWFVLEHEPQLYTRAMSARIANAESSLDRHYPLNEDETLELDYWSERLSTGKFYRKMDESSFHPNVLISSDASNHGMGAVLHYQSFKESISSNLPPEAQSESSTFRELLAVEFALKSWKHIIRNSNLELRVDSQAAASILEKGSNNPDLHRITHRILEILAETRTSLAIRWVLRTDNFEADLASRLIDFDDWGIQPNIAALLQQRWGKPTIDMFATEYNTKAAVFVGRSRSGACNQIAIDALAPENYNLWQKGTLWLVPPPGLIHATMNVLRRMKGTAILGLPYWPSHRAFSALKALGGNWIKEVRDGILFPTGTKLFTKPTVPSEAFISEFSSFPFFFVLLDFSPNPIPPSPLRFL
ncbi:hypothetical protein Y032_0040g270 [Ancylostoma ceylanicum]|uniref:Reverse transcriptase domain-containing protein n=1 Tax=Ancylostoma ceylanicum TaxID=53326 RepID=A0A016UGU9_9BILA|nr:hypothetical protein Y032_0040g270 [Ancylostoma ceylanicum]